MGIEAEPVAIAPAYPLGGSTQLKGSYQRPIPLDDDKQLDGLPSHPPQKKRKRDATDYEDIIFLPSKALKQPTIPSKTKGAASWRRQRESEQDSEYADIDGFAGEPAKKVKSAGKSKAKPSEKPRKEPEEKRLRKFRPHAPLSYQEIANRALTQRMCVLDRQRVGTVEQPGQVFEVAGSTGNVYTVKVDKVPSCDCPHAVKGNQCKHIVYVMLRTLKAPSHLSYQLALTSTELKELFDHAPPIPSETETSDTSSHDGNRKALDGECPICYDEFSENEQNVWCKDGCGNNIHSGCFEKWAAQRKQVADKITCPFCRTEWRQDDIKLGKGAGTVCEDGYRNVASELGLSGDRDYSTYHPFWVRKQRRNGYIQDGGGYYDGW